MTGDKLDLISDIDMYEFIEKVMRGVLSYLAQSYNYGKNGIINSFDKNYPSKQITYLDPNNLYGSVMT